jgi:hypothetical protein
LPQLGQWPLASACRIRTMHAQQCARPMIPTGAPQLTQSRCRFPIAHRPRHSALVTTGATIDPAR